jgi:hypothetical protein
MVFLQGEYFGAQKTPAFAGVGKMALLRFVIY